MCFLREQETPNAQPNEPMFLAAFRSAEDSWNRLAPSTPRQGGPGALRLRWSKPIPRPRRTRKSSYIQRVRRPRILCRMALITYKIVNDEGGKVKKAARVACNFWNAYVTPS